MKRLIPFSLVTIGFATAAIAQELPAFEEVDANRDGRISSQEASVVEGLDFSSADANQDGSLDRAEYIAASGQ